MDDVRSCRLTQLHVTVSMTNALFKSSTMQPSKLFMSMVLRIQSHPSLLATTIIPQHPHHHHHHHLAIPDDVACGGQPAINGRKTRDKRSLRKTACAKTKQNTPTTARLWAGKPSGHGRHKQQATRSGKPGKTTPQSRCIPASPV